MDTKSNLRANKRMQPDQTTRYARGLAADAGRYVRFQYEADIQ